MEILVLLFFLAAVWAGISTARVWLAEMAGRLVANIGGRKKRGVRSYKMAVLSYYFRARVAGLILKVWGRLPRKRGS